MSVPRAIHQLSVLIIASSLLFNVATANTVTGERGAIASRSVIASEIGIDILKQGGNAVDAAVAVGFALAVTYPSAGNLGGGGYLLIRMNNGEVAALDARETAPGAADKDMFLDQDGEVNRRLAMGSHLSSGVPGSVAGYLDALDRFGTMTREEVLAPAIRLAEEGLRLDQDLAEQFQENLRSMQAYPASMAIFSKNGQPYSEGDVWIQKDLAATLKLISQQGKDGFYKGRTADLIVAEMQRNGGLISHQDLENYRTVWREPIRGEYRGHEIWSMPPSSSGGIVLMQMLNMLEPYELKGMGWGTNATVHLMVEAQKRAYADRARHLGDSDFYPVPVATLISKSYAQQRFADFDPTRATPSDAIMAGSVPAESPQTTHYSVLDGQGNAVAVTTTLNSGYGNKAIVADAGFLLNNEMGDFTPKPNTSAAFGLLGEEANLIQPGKRMLSSMTPTIVTRDEQTVLITGSPGGATIINTVFQVIVNVLDHQMSVEDAVARPRFHHQWQPDSIRFENDAFSAEVQAELESMGHQQIRSAGFGLGDANSIYFDGKTLTATSDPRNPGGAAAW